MRDLLQTGSAWLDRMRKAHASSTVTYRRGSDEFTLAATKGRSEFNVEDAEGAFVKVESADFLVTPADMKINSLPIEPVDGDEIEETIGADVRVYQVLSPDGSPPWRWCDSHKTTMRIHTKLTQRRAA